MSEITTPEGLKKKYRQIWNRVYARCRMRLGLTPQQSAKSADVEVKLAQEELSRVKRIQQTLEKEI